MPDKMKLEDFRLTPEMKAWITTYKSIDKMTKMLEKGLALQSSELEQSRMIYNETQNKKAQLLNIAPVGQERELPGQEV